MDVYTSTLLLLVVTTGTRAENIALGRPTNQTGGSPADHTSDLAVDGRYGDPSGDDTYCAGPYQLQGVPPVDWWLNLEALYTIKSITLHNTYAQYYHYFTFFTVGILDGVNPEVICGNKTTAGTAGEVVTFMCPPSSQAQYIRVSRYGGYDLYLCEVEVNSGLIGYTNQMATATATANNTIKVEWEQITVDTGVDLYYRISWGSSLKVIQNDPETSTGSLLIDDLQANTEYQILITPFQQTADGELAGQAYPNLTTTTLCDNPEVPEISSVSVSGMSVTVNYVVVPTSTCDYLESVSVLIIPWGASYRFEYLASLTETTFTTQLAPGDYSFKLVVFNNADLPSYSTTRNITVGDSLAVVQECSPGVGPLSGGTNITIRGREFNQGAQFVYLGSAIKAPVYFWSFGEIRVQTPVVGEEFRDVSVPLTVEFYGVHNITSPCTFVIKGDPEITTIEPLTTIKEGGTLLTVKGRSMDSVASPVLEVTVDISDRKYKQGCDVGNSSAIFCRVPQMVLPPQNVTLYLGFILDGVPDYRDLRNNPDLLQYSQILISKSPGFTNGSLQEYFFKPKQLLNIPGNNVRNIRLTDYEVLVGQELCELKNYSDTYLHCLPPQSKPSPRAGEHHPLLVVSVGSYTRYAVGTLNYDATSTNLGLIIGCAAGGAVLVVVIVTVIALVVVRKKRQEKPKRESSLVKVDSDRQIQLGVIQAENFTGFPE